MCLQLARVDEVVAQTLGVLRVLIVGASRLGKHVVFQVLVVLETWSADVVKCRILYCARLYCWCQLMLVV